MPRRFAMSVLRTRCQQRCDKVKDPSIDASEWNSLISEMMGELYEVVAGAGLGYFEEAATIPTTGAASYNEPADHLATVGVDWIINTTTGEARELTEIMAGERMRWTGQTGTALVYILVDNQIYLYPVPPAGQTYRIRYVPQPPDYSSAADGDLVDVVTPDGEAFLAWGVAVKALAKGEYSTDLALQEREAARVRLTDWAIQRSASPRGRVVRPEGYDPTDFDPADWKWR